MTIAKFAVLILLFTALAFSQATQPAPPSSLNPDHFVGVGMGFQSASNRQVSGWTNYCTKTTERVYACAMTDMTGGTSSVRAGVETIIFQQGYFTLTAKADAGVSTGSNASVGGSYGAGGSGLVNISKWSKIPNLFMVGSVSWIKSDVPDTNAGAGPLSIFGSRATFRFGFGRTF